MPVDTKKQQLADKVEEVIQNRDFGYILLLTDAYLYEEMVQEAFEKKDLPDFIESEDVRHKLILTNKQSPEGWSEVLTKNELINDQEIQKAIDNEDELVTAMLNEIEGNFDVDVEIQEELDEILQRKPDVKTLSDALEQAYDEREFVEFLKEEDNELLEENWKEALQEQGFPNHLDKNSNDIDYTVHVTITKSFDDLAERYLDEAREEQNANLYAAKDINQILVNEKAYELEIEIESDAEDFNE